MMNSSTAPMAASSPPTIDIEGLGLDQGALVLAAFTAGVIDAIAGGGGLITVPALLWAGIPPHFVFGTNKGSAVFGALALGGVTAAAVAVSRRARARLGAADALLALFVVAYLLLHWLWAVPAWDRYLLPVLPLVAALLGRGVEAVAGLKKKETTDYTDFTDYKTKKSVKSVVTSSYVLMIGLLIAVAVLHLPVAAAARAGRYTYFCESTQM